MAVLIIYQKYILRTHFMYSKEYWTQTESQFHQSSSSSDSRQRWLVSRNI